MGRGAVPSMDTSKLERQIGHVRSRSTAPDTRPKQTTRVKTASKSTTQSADQSTPQHLRHHFNASPMSLPSMAQKDAADVYEGADVSAQQQQQQQLEARSTTPNSSTIHREATTTTTSTSDSATLASPERRKKRQRNSSVCNECKASPKKTKKRLRWSTITIHEFGVGLGGSSVPGKGGPSIGLSDKPEFTWTTRVGQMAERVEGVHRFTPDERVQLLQSAGVSEGMILRFTREASIINCSRRRTLVEDIAKRKRAKKQQRLQAESLCTVLERPCSSSFLDRPHMIPVNYV